MKLGLSRGQRMKRKSKNSALKAILVIEAIVFVFACFGFMLILVNPGMLFPEKKPVTQAQPAISPVTPTSSAPAPSTLTPESGQAPLSEIPVVDFSLPSTNNVLPTDILEEIGYYAGGGGPDYSICTEPRIAMDPSDAELMTLNGFVVCGYPTDQVLVGKILYPDGRMVTENVKPLPSGGETYFAELTFKPKIDDPVGVYTFSLESADGKFESNAYYRKPDGVRVFKLDNTHLLLYGFAPHEFVNLYYYRANGASWQFESWKDYQVDQAGQLVVSVSIGQAEGEFDNNQLGVYGWSFTFIAIGEKTGEVPLYHNGPLGGNFTLLGGSISGQDKTPASINLKCSAEQLDQGRLLVGYHAIVVKPIGIFANPRSGARQIDTVPANSMIYVFLGPYCDGSQIWWRVDTDVGTGYVLEKDNEYFIEPLSLAADFCGGLQSTYTKGDWIKVVFPDDADMNVREKAGFSGNIIFTLPRESYLQIKDGPQCVDGTIWWHITDYSDSGWIAEYQNGVHLFGPYPFQ